MQKHDIRNDVWLDGLESRSTGLRCRGANGTSLTSAGPAARPLSTEAPMKLPYEVALALQIALPKQMSEERSRTGRLPKELLMGTLKQLAGNEVLQWRREMGSTR